MYTRYSIFSDMDIFPLFVKLTDMIDNGYVVFSDNDITNS